jgi:hypothetical protein
VYQIIYERQELFPRMAGFRLPRSCLIDSVRSSMNSSGFPFRSASGSLFQDVDGRIHIPVMLFAVHPTLPFARHAGGWIRSQCHKQNRAYWMATSGQC